VAPPPRSPAAALHHLLQSLAVAGRLCLVLAVHERHPYAVRGAARRIGDVVVIGMTPLPPPSHITAALRNQPVAGLAPRGHTTLRLILPVKASVYPSLLHAIAFLLRMVWYTAVWDSISCPFTTLLRTTLPTPRYSLLCCLDVQRMRWLAFISGYLRLWFSVLLSPRYQAGSWNRRKGMPYMQRTFFSYPLTKRAVCSFAGVLYLEGRPVRVRDHCGLLTERLAKIRRAKAFIQPWVATRSVSFGSLTGSSVAVTRWKAHVPYHTFAAHTRVPFRARLRTSQRRRRCRPSPLTLRFACAHTTLVLPCRCALAFVRRARHALRVTYLLFCNG